MAWNRHSIAVFHQAISLAPAHADLYFKLGKVLGDMENWRGAIGGLKSALGMEDRPIANWRGAIAAFESTLGIEERPDVWANPADVYARRFEKTHDDEHKQMAWNACKRAMNYASGADQTTLNVTKQALERIGEAEAAARIESIPLLLERLKRQETESLHDYIKRLEALLSHYSGWDWAYAQIKIHLARVYVPDAPSRAKTCYEEAITKLNAEHPLEIKEQGLHVALANVSRLEGEIDKALSHAETAVAHYPQGAWERGTNLKRALQRVHAANRLIPSTTPSKRQAYQAKYHSCLGWVLLRSGDTRKAVKELEQTVAQSADEEAYYHLAEAYFALAQGDGSGRTQWVAKAYDACIHAGEADLRGVYRQQIADLQQRLAELATDTPVKSAVPRIESVAVSSRDGKSDTGHGSDLVGDRHAR
jgi:tetratricopeptide (TPR) repeat protein